MKAWWEDLNIREQRLVIAMAVFVTIGILYFSIWRPLNDSLASANLK